MTLNSLDNDFRRYITTAIREVSRRFTDASQLALGGDLVSATDRLGELRDKLLSPGGTFDRLRRETFRRSFGHHLRTLPPSIVRTDLTYHRNLEDVAATAPIRDIDPATVIGRLIREAGELLPLLHAAYPMGSEMRPAMMRDWAARNGDDVTAAVKRLISDLQMTLDGVARDLILKPEMR